MPRERETLPPELVSLQRACNVWSAKRWHSFAEHRARLTSLVRQAAPPSGGRLAVLGAGNGNDLDVAALLRRYSEVHLYDLDGPALGRAWQRHHAPGLVIHPPIDLSGALALLPGLSQRCPGDEEIAALPQACVDRVLGAIPQRYEVVLSACLLSQILHGTHVALGHQHPSLTAVSCAQVLAHARILAGLLRPGGRGLLVTDATSSQLVPSPELWGDAVPASDLLAQLEAAHLCAAGTGPRFLHRVLTEDRLLGPLLLDTTSVEPWRWRWSSRRTYLVHALAFTVRSSSSTADSPRCGAGRPVLHGEDTLR
jgi:hypothetical protein